MRHTAPPLTQLGRGGERGRDPTLLAREAVEDHYWMALLTRTRALLPSGRLSWRGGPVEAVVTSREREGGGSERRKVIPSSPTYIHTTGLWTSIRSMLVLCDWHQNDCVCVLV